MNKKRLWYDEINCNEILFILKTTKFHPTKICVSSVLKQLIYKTCLQVEFFHDSLFIYMYLDVNSNRHNKFFLILEKTDISFSPCLWALCSGPLPWLGGEKIQVRWLGQCASGNKGVYSELTSCSSAGPLPPAEIPSCLVLSQRCILSHSQTTDQCQLCTYRSTLLIVFSDISGIFIP